MWYQGLKPPFKSSIKRGSPKGTICITFLFNIWREAIATLGFFDTNAKAEEFRITTGGSESERATHTGFGKGYRHVQMRVPGQNKVKFEEEAPNLLKIST